MKIFLHGSFDIRQISKILKVEYRFVQSLGFGFHTIEKMIHFKLEKILNGNRRKRMTMKYL